jgi:hypothetical protein
MQAINYVTGHWSEICSGAAGFVIFARVVVKLTPTPKDDTVLEKVVNFVKHLGLHIK